MSEINIQPILRELNGISNALVAVNNNVNGVSTQVSVVSQEQRETRDKLTHLYEEFERFRRESQLARNKQYSLTNIGNLTSEMEREFGSNRKVRKTAIGMLQAFDVGLISEETASRVAEELLLEAKQYWLAPVTVALAAWASDEPDVCDQALNVAFARSPHHTSLFMALVLRRQGRQDSALRWLRHYLEAQDPRALGHNFGAVLETVAYGAFGPAGMATISEYLERWSVELAMDEAAQAEPVRLWRREIEQHQLADASDRFPRLAEMSPEWDQMNGALRAAGALGNVRQKYEAMLAEEIPYDSNLEDRVDDILDHLVIDDDDAELPLRREIVRHQAIIDNGGDTEKADEVVNATLGALATKLDYLAVQAHAALNPELIGVSRTTQRIAVASCREWFSRAVTDHAKGYRSQVPADVQVIFDTNHHVAAKRFGLPRWKGSFTKPIAQLEKSLGAHWDRNGQTYIDGLAVRVQGQAVAATVVSILVLLLCGGAVNWVLGVLLGLVIGVVWGVILANRVEKGRVAQASAERDLQAAKADSLRRLNAAAVELTDWTAEFRKLDAEEKALLEFVDNLATATGNATSFERRTILPA